MQTLKNLVLWCRKYLSPGGLAVLAAIVYMVFFQDNSMSRIYAYEKTIDSLQVQIGIQRDSLEHYRNLNLRLDNRDPQMIERIVRENHNMNRVDEEVFVCR